MKFPNANNTNITSFLDGYFSELESQMCSYTGETKPSPDRLDALVWAMTELSKSRGEVNWRIS